MKIPVPSLLLPRRPSTWRCWAVPAVWAGLTLNLVLAVARFQPNVLTWDQWDFLNPLFYGGSIWDLFRYQHGPHRQGLGFVITAGWLHLSHWDARWDSLWIVALLSIAAALALRLKREFTGRLTLADIWIPLVGLSLGQFESFLFTPNASHSAFPLALLLAVANLWLSPRPSVRFLAGGCGAFALAFTGFGLFGAVVLTFLLAAAALRHAVQKEFRLAALAGAGFAIAAIGWILFAKDYVFAPAVPGFRFPWSPWSDYPRFIVLMLAYAAALSEPAPGAYLAGGALALLASAAGLLVLWRWLHTRSPSPRHDVVLLLLGAGLLFVLNTAVGRVSLGVNGGMVSRYLTLVFPLWLGLGLADNITERRVLRFTALVALWFIALWPYRDTARRPLRQWPGTLGVTLGQYAEIDETTTAKAAWVDRYLETGSIDAAQAAVGDAIYPAPAATRLDEKLRFLRERHLSFFAAPSGADAFLPWLVAEKVIWNHQFPAWNQPVALNAAATLTYVARHDGLIAIPVRVSSRQPDSLATLSIRFRDRQYRTILADPVTVLVVPVRAGFNEVRLQREPAAAAHQASVPLVGGPVTRVNAPPQGAVLLEERP